MKFLVKIRKMRQLVLKCRKYFVFFLFILLSSASCDKIQDSQVPKFPLSFTINLNIANELTKSGEIKKGLTILINHL